MNQPRRRLADDPAQAGLFDLDDPTIVDNSPQARLMARVAARLPDDAVLRPADGTGPTVLVPLVADGTYGRVRGLSLHRTPITAQGYVVAARVLRGGIGGWHPDRLVVVTLADLPGGPAVATVQTEMDARLTVLEPASGMPPGEGPPWLRMPVEQQILAAGTVLGLTVRVLDGPHNELWAVQGCPEQLTGRVAWWLFGGDYGSWEGRARPVFSATRLHEAARAGRLRPNDDNPAPTDPSDSPAETPLRRRRESRPGIGRQRRQVTAWIAQGLTYQSIADAARRADSDDFTTADGTVLGIEEVDAYLADAAGRALHGQDQLPGLRWRGVAATFDPVDEQTTQMRLSADDVIHVRIPVPAGWISDPGAGRIRRAITDTIDTAHSRAARLIAAGNELADRIATPAQRPLVGPSPVAAAEPSVGLDPTKSIASVAFVRPPHTPAGPADPPWSTSTGPAPQSSTTPGNHR